jgi:hypothetical protein
VEGDKESIEIRYYLSNLAVDAKLFARAVRGHWSVENACEAAVPGGGGWLL